MEEIFDHLLKAKAPDIFKMKTASALKFHILFFAFRRIFPLNFTLRNFFLPPARQDNGYELLKKLYHSLNIG